MKKLLHVLITGVFLVSVLGSLFAGGQQDAGTAAETAAPVTIRIMGYGGQDPAIVVRLLDEVIGDDLAAEGIELSYEPIEGDYNAGLYNALSAGTAGDIVYVPAESAPGIIATGQILPLNGLMDVSPFIDSLIQTYTIDGKVYGIAKDFNTLALHYNKDLFDEAGVAYPDETDTWESLAEKCRQVSTLGNDIYGISFPASFDRFGAFAFATGWETNAIEETTNLLDPRFKKAVEWYTNLVKEGVAVQPSDLGQGWTGGAFATEQVGIAIEGAWILGFLRNEAPNISFGTTYMPKSPSGKRGNFLFTVAYGINKNTKEQEAALKVLKALTSEKAQRFILQEGLAIPSRKSLSNDPYFNQDSPEARANKVVFEGASMGNVEGFQFGRIGTDWQSPVNEALASIMTGQLSTDQALEEAQKGLKSLFSR